MGGGPGNSPLVIVCELSKADLLNNCKRNDTILSSFWPQRKTSKRRVEYHKFVHRHAKRLLHSCHDQKLINIPRQKTKQPRVPIDGDIETPCIHHARWGATCWSWQGVVILEFVKTFRYFNNLKAKLKLLVVSRSANLRANSQFEGSLSLICWVVFAES